MEIEKGNPWLNPAAALKNLSRDGLTYVFCWLPVTRPEKNQADFREKSFDFHFLYISIVQIRCATHFAVEVCQLRVPYYL